MNNAEECGGGNEGAIDIGLTDVAFNAESIGRMREARLLQVPVHQKVYFVAAEAHLESEIVKNRQRVCRLGNAARMTEEC